MAEIDSEDIAKIKKVVVAAVTEAEETVNANVMRLMNEETKSKEEKEEEKAEEEEEEEQQQQQKEQEEQEEEQEKEEVLLVEKGKDNNDKPSNSTDAFLSLKKSIEDVTINNSKDNSCSSCSTNESTSKIDNSINEINNVEKDVEEIKEKEKVEENKDSENENGNAAMISEVIEKSNIAETEAHSTDEKDTIDREQSTDSILESITTNTNEEQVLENLEIKKEVNKDNINIDEETSLEGENQELKKESVEKKKSINNDEQLEVGIVGPPTAVSELINEEELHGESALSAEEKVQDQATEWVEKSVTTDILITGETEEEEENEIASNCRRRRRNLRDRRKIKKENGDLLLVSTRKSQKIVSNIIKRSIKCLSTDKARIRDGIQDCAIGKGEETERGKAQKSKGEEILTVRPSK
ncbi:hypothetical protein M0802_004953 [Mischocyttarus mexicanus]|nr:hypothetical protein M0802_004953 [Mischocyttarus mexicanus]